MRKKSDDQVDLKGRVLGRVVSEELKAVTGGAVKIVNSGNGKQDITDGSAVDDPPII
jgi:hypothetical protein